MALIKCPECGNEISTNAKACPHCGSEIVICPECNAVYAGKVQICANCGYKFAKTEEQKIINDTLETKDERLLLDRAFSYRKTDKLFRIGRRVLDLLSFALWVIGLIILIVWSKKEPLDLLFTAESTLRNIKIVVAIGCIIYILSEIYDTLSSNLLYIKFGDWLTSNDMEVKDYIKLHGNDLTSPGTAEQADYMIIANGEFFRTHPKERNYLYIVTVIVGILSLVAAVLIGYCFVENIKIIMGFSLMEEKFDFSKLNFIWIGVAVAAFILNSIISLILTLRQDGRFDRWLKDIMKTEEADKTEENA